MSTATLTAPAAEIGILRSKAGALRDNASTMGPLALTYRRRAAELELQAAALSARLGLDAPVAVAA